MISKKNKGITLIALVITIIVMLILVIVTISIVAEGGLIEKSRKATFLQEIAAYKEELQDYLLGHYGDETDYETADGEIKPLTEAIDEKLFYVPRGTKQEDIKGDEDPKKYALKDCIKSFNEEKYAEMFLIEENELKFYDDGNHKKEAKWLEEEATNGNKIVDVKYEKAKVTFKIEGEGEIQGIEGMELDAKVGERFNLKAVPKTITAGETTVEFEFTRWLKNGKEISEEENLTIEVTGDTEYTAVFEPAKTLIYYIDNGEEKIFASVDEKINSSTYSSTISDKTTITKVFFGKNVKTIESSAFSGGTGITVIKSSKEAAIELTTTSTFEKCTSLEEVYLPNIKSWSTYAGGFEFSGCTALKTVTLGSVGHPVPSNSAGKMFIGGIDSHPNLTIKMYIDTNGGTVISKDGEPWNASNATIEYYDAETGELVNLVIGQKYKANTEIDWAEFPNSDKITNIKGNAFQNCTNLKITEIPKNCPTIGGSAFSGCTGITRISSPEDLPLDLGLSAFSKCTSLEEVYLPNIKTWSIYAGGFEFDGCTALKTVTLGSVGHPVPNDSAGKMFIGGIDSHSNLTIKMYIDTNGGTVISKGGEPWYASNATIEYYDAETGELVNLVIGQKYKANTEIDWAEFPNSDKITNIKGNAFQNCTNLKITEIPKNCPTIGGSAFSGCTGITRISSPEDLPIEIELAAFEKCTSLEEVYLPNIKTWSTYHGGFEFSGCTALKTVTLGSIGHPVPNDMPAKMFSGVSNFTVKIYIDKTTNESKSFVGYFGQASNVNVEYYDCVTGEIIN